MSTPGGNDDNERIDDLAGEPGIPEVLAALAETVAVGPPLSLRDQLVAEIGRRPRAGAAPASAPDLYRSRVVVMRQLLDELRGGDWTAVVAPYRWTTHRLVAHLAVIEEYTARQLGLTGEAPLPPGDPSAGDHLGLGAAEADEIAAGAPEASVARWWAAAGRVAAHVGSAAFDPSAPVPLHQWPFDAATALVARSFELWTHGDDIRRATGRSLEEVPAEELRIMSSTSVAGLPLLLALQPPPDAEPPAVLTPTRVVLTGPGGGTFALGGPGPQVNLLVADVVDYCRVVSRRLAPHEMASTREGDKRLLSSLLVAAQAIAV
ncbi:MAG: maleylpyruvate isomerase N-terminal domain-containing protein [Acidimicrobiia bacterium]|nr:maleylpyruvate isomerase N-terminal domain-containing protein [Acidimicrobiia bacterium]MDH4363272.1 maleylpyruvate isomerase N-terminal domain-containing protein [Acidimicrobiia bacterium]MDH5291374.1 maleylpyruvate isomerase N-terminal domain-containing protein [Acidimicrobiia bacterium]